MKKIKITENRYIGEDEPVFIIAEAGINHNGDINSAKKMIDAAKSVGVDAVKFQTFKAEEFITDVKQTYTYKSQGKEITESMLEMFKRYEFSEKNWIEIIQYCKEKDIIFFSTPQNPSDLDFLLTITDLPVIKVGSDDLTNLDLLKYYASKNKAMIISSGMAYLSEIEDAVLTVKDAGNEQLIVLHCVSSYPADPEEINMSKMKTIENAFNIITGFSDHTQGIEAAVLAVAFGAKVIEKHFTLDNNSAGPDHWFSSDTQELNQFVKAIRKTEKMIGQKVIVPTLKELKIRETCRRSIVAKENIDKNEKITEDKIEFKRPGTGLSPKFKEYFINKTVNNDIKAGSIITFDDII